MNRQRDWNNLSLSLSRTPHIGNNPLLTDSFWMKLFFHQLVTSKFTSKCINRRDKLFRITHSLTAFNRKNTILFNLVRSFFRAILLPERSWIFQSKNNGNVNVLKTHSTLHIYLNFALIFFFILMVILNPNIFSWKILEGIKIAKVI